MKKLQKSSKPNNTAAATIPGNAIQRLSIESIEAVLSQLSLAHLSMAAAVLKSWAGAVASSDHVWKQLFQAHFWGFTLGGLHLGRHSWRSIFCSTLDAMRRQFVMCNSALCVQMTPMNQRINLKAYVKMLGQRAYSKAVEQQWRDIMSHSDDMIAAVLGELIMFRALVPVYGPTRRKFESKALLKEKRQRLRARGLKPRHAGTGLFETLIQPPARVIDGTVFEGTDWHDTVSPTYNDDVDFCLKNEGLYPGTVADQANAMIESDSLSAEMARFVMGKQVCAMEEECDRWFVHDYAVGGNVAPIPFTTLEPIQIHPLSEAVARHSSTTRKLGYFEVEIVGKGSVGLGTAREHFASRAPAHVGWQETSVGYHSHDGSKWIADSKHPPLRQIRGLPYATPYGSEACDPYDDWLPPRTGEGDFVGCGVDFETREVFFTLNGRMQGVAFAEVELYSDDGRVQLHPCVALHDSLGSVGSVGKVRADRFRINLGTEPFKFDLSHYFSKSRALPGPDSSNQMAVDSEGASMFDLNEDEAELVHQVEFATHCLLCCFDIVMTEEQRAASGLADGPMDDLGNGLVLPSAEIATNAAMVMVSEPYEDWADWMKVHFQITDDGLQPLFPPAMFEAWFEGTYSVSL